MAKKKAKASKDPSQTSIFDAATKAKLLADNAAQLADFAATALDAAEQLRIKTKPIENITLSPVQREVLLAIPTISRPNNRKLAKDGIDFTVADVASMTMAISEHLTNAALPQQVALLRLGKHLIDQLHKYIDAKGKIALKASTSPKAKAGSSVIYQFKITLIGSKPPIWRRIQVEDCTLDKLHEHIQTAMGWTNSHLHRFEIGDRQYADPMLTEEDMEEFGYIDSTRTKLSQILPKTGKRLRIRYEYDFGDGWEHEVLFEGSFQKEPGKKYPICVDGARACPPEDVGGIFGFYEFLEALADPKHEEHENYVEWAGDFDSMEFDVGKATKAMKKGLPDWRR